jgi:hypothetical protein
MNDVTKPLHIYFRPEMTGNQRFIYRRQSLAGTVATDFSTRIAYHPSWRQPSQLFDDQKQEQENQHLADIREDIRILYRELRRTMDFVTAQDVRSKYLKQRENRTLVQCLDHHLKLFRAQPRSPSDAFEARAENQLSVEDYYAFFLSPMPSKIIFSLGSFIAT